MNQTEIRNYHLCWITFYCDIYYKSNNDSRSSINVDFSAMKQNTFLYKY